MSKAETAIIASVAALAGAVAGAAGVYVLGRRRLLARPTQRLIGEQARLDPAPGHVYWVGSLALLDDRAKWRVINNTFPLDIIERKAPKPPTSIFNLPCVGYFELTRYEPADFEVGLLPGQIGDLTVIEARNNSPEKSKRLNAYLWDLVRLTVLIPGGVFSHWPRQQPDGTWTNRLDSASIAEMVGQL